MGFCATSIHKEVFDELRRNGFDAATSTAEEVKEEKPAVRRAGRRLPICGSSRTAYRSDDSISPADVLVTGMIISSCMNDDVSGGDYDSGSSFDSCDSSGWD